MDSTEQRQRDFGSAIMAGFPKLDLPGWPMASACAAVGNGMQENLCRPVTFGPQDHGSDGVMQWRLSRLAEMKKWCITNFGRWDTLEAQAAFMMFEMRRDYPGLYSDLASGAKTIPTLTANICTTYERPAAASAMLDKRIKYAEDAHAILIGKPVPKPPSKAVAGTVVATASAAGTAHVSGVPVWAVLLILLIGCSLTAAIVWWEMKKRAAK